MLVAMWQHIHQLTGCSYWHKEFMLDKVRGSDFIVEVRNVRGKFKQNNFNAKTLKGTVVCIKTQIIPY